MAYNYFPQTYQTPSYYPSQPQPQPPQQAQTQSLIWVQGEAGAKSYLVAPNSTVTLWDSEAQTIYIKSADATGMPSIRTLDYTIRGGEEKAVNYATKDDFDRIEKEIDAIKKSLGKEKK
jgi:hypothetical protein